MSRDGSITPSDLVGKLDWLVVSCEKCGRLGRYNVTRLVEQPGADAKLPIGSLGSRRIVRAAGRSICPISAERDAPTCRECCDGPGSSPLGAGGSGDDASARRPYGRSGMIPLGGIIAHRELRRLAKAQD
jgi:hypothetical protein